MEADTFWTARDYLAMHDDIRQLKNAVGQQQTDMVDVKAQITNMTAIATRILLVLSAATVSGIVGLALLVLQGR